MKRMTLLLCFAWISLQAQTDKIPRDLLLRDAQQLMDILESSHPDPYSGAGGRIAFHRIYRRLLENLPEEGMSPEAFYRHLAPLVASIGDSHTALLFSSPTTGPGLPLKLKILGESLVIEGVPGEKYRNLIGSRITAIESISLDTLIRRMASLRGAENRTTLLALLSLRLANRSGIQILIPERKDLKTIRLSLLSRRGEIQVAMEPADPETLITQPSVVEMPSLVNSDIGHQFLDPDRRTALLLISNMMRYREACESWLSSGFSEAEEFAKEAYRHFHQTDPPQDPENLLAGIPSAAEDIALLLRQMKEAGSQNLIIDLRENTGGNGVLIEILLSLLFGEKRAAAFEQGYSIPRYSELYFSNYTEVTLEKLNGGRSVLLRTGDYDFSEEPGASGRHLANSTRWIEFTGSMPSFREILKTIPEKGIYTPEKILVLCSAMTYSSGFNLLTALSKEGAVILGNTPAQAGNNFGDTLLFQLTHSGIRGGVSYKRIITFPNDPEKGRSLTPDIVMTYDRLAKLKFDPNAEILMALDWLYRR